MNIKKIKTASLQAIYDRCRKKRVEGIWYEVLRFGWIADKCMIEMNNRIKEGRHEWMKK